MSDQNNPNGSNVQPVDLNSSNDNGSATTWTASNNRKCKQTFGKCQRCGKYEKKTMHMQCHHITCCFTCAKDCKGCPHPQCGLPVIGEKNRHLAVYACYSVDPDTVTTTAAIEAEMFESMAPSNETEENDCEDGSEQAEAIEIEQRTVMQNEDNFDSIMPNMNDENTTNKEKDPRDELYDSTSTTMLGICSVCLSGEATCFILSEDERQTEPACGHDLCIECVNKFYDCPFCRRRIISYLEVRN